MALYNLHTFYRQCDLKYGSRWQCTQRSRKLKCNAYLVLDANGDVLKKNDYHPHEPPRYHISSDGTYTKVREIPVMNENLCKMLFR